MKTTFPPHARALLHQTPAGAVVIVENGTAVTHLFFSRMAQPEHFGMGGNTPAASNG